MWDILQASAFLCDENGISGNGLVEPLTRLLPCIYCRNSFVTFYSQLGPPADTKCAFWMNKVHNLVNYKLITQKAEATGLGRDFTIHSSKLLSEPTFEVLKKRFIVNREEPIVRRSLLTALLAIVMALELKNTPDDLQSFNIFIKILKDVIQVARQDNSTFLIGILDKLDPNEGPTKMRQILEYYKYSNVQEPVVKQAHEASSLIKAGACIKGTCV
jgi:hypothetical protein